MKTAGFQYANVLGISLLVTTLAWTSLLGARDADSSVPRMMNAARLFERQGRHSKAAEMYRRVLRLAPGNEYAAKRLNALRAMSTRVMEISGVSESSAPAVQPVAAAKEDPKGEPKLLVNAPGRQVKSQKQILKSTQLALSKIRNKIVGRPKPDTREPVVEEGVTPVAYSVVRKDSKAEPKPVVNARRRQARTPKQILETTQSALNKIRDKIVGRPSPVAEEGAIPVADRSRLWERLDPVLGGLADIVVMSPSEKAAKGHQSLVPRPDDAGAVTLLVDAVTYTPDAESALAAYMLGTRTTGQDMVMASLGEQLGVRKGFARVHVAEAMLRLDGNHAVATDALIELVSSSEKDVRMMAALAMQSAAATQRDRCIQVLILLLSDGDSELRAVAALALGGYGMSAKVAVPALMQLVRDENADAARAAGVALRCVFPEPVAPISSTSVRRTVAHGS